MTATHQGLIGKCPVAHSFDAMADDYYIDPAKYLQKFSVETPTFFYPHMNAWIVTRYDDAFEVLTDWQRFSSTANSAEMEVPEEYQDIISNELMSRIILGSDPEGHTVSRGVAQLGFLQADMEALQPEIEARAHRIIDGFEQNGAGNLIEEYCLELTTQTILAHLGLGYEDAEFIEQMRDDFFMVLSSAHEPLEEPLRSQVWSRYVASNIRMREIVESRRNSNERDLISMMAKQKNPDGTYILDADQIAIHVTEFASAGTDTTAQAMANAILFLQENPEAKQDALWEPENWPRVFEETIRRRNSSTFTARLAKEDVTIGDVEIKAGDRVLVALTGANTDPQHTPNPFDFDIHRPDPEDHLGFSTGRHKCLGNPLARVQGPTGLKVLYERLPSITVDDPDALDFIKFALLPARRSLWGHWDLADIERSKQAQVRTLNLNVAERREEADGVISLKLVHPDGGALPPWKPGAHIDLHLPAIDEEGNDIVRQYSLSGDPQDTSYYRVGVLKEIAGRGGSETIHDQVHEGDTIMVSWPRNNFHFAQSDHYLFIAGGIGITPILPMIREAEKVGKDWQLIYGGRSRTTMAFLDELQAYGDRITLVPSDQMGNIDLPSLLGDAQDHTLIYCCGPEGLLNAVETQSDHWPKNSLRLERFAPKTIVRDFEDTSFEVEFSETGRTIEVAADESILDAATNAGLTVISSCKTGTCGTCETSIVSGAVDHRDSILTDDEQAENETMMICVSRAAQGCAKLVLAR